MPSAVAAHVEKLGIADSSHPTPLLGWCIKLDASELCLRDSNQFAIDYLKARLAGDPRQLQHLADSEPGQGAYSLGRGRSVCFG